MRDLPDDNLSYPVLIQLENGSSGSGFILRVDNTTYLVTAKHVLFHKLEKEKDVSLISSSATFLCYSRDLKIKEPIIHRLDLALLHEQGSIKPHTVADVVIIKIADLEKTQTGFKLHFIKGVSFLRGPKEQSFVGIPKERFKNYEDTLISNEAIVFGYPNSLGIEGQNQIDYLRPLLRKGIIAGKNDKNKTIILDCPAYYGNSGGLVVEIEVISPGNTKIHCIGVVSQYIPFVEKLLSLQHRTINTNIENSGYSVVVPIDTILELL